MQLNDAALSVSWCHGIVLMFLARTHANEVRHCWEPFKWCCKEHLHLWQNMFCSLTSSSPDLYLLAPSEHIEGVRNVLQQGDGELHRWKAAKTSPGEAGG
jgi:hypothetical protein